MRRTLATIIGLTFAGTVLATSATTSLFHQIDKNADGYLTRTELATAGVFDLIPIRADTNQDGRITRSEYAAVTSPTGGDQTDEVATTY